MNTDHQNEEQPTRRRENLQHQAEHTRTRRHMSVMGYLAVLFAIAFLLLLLAYFQQQRTNSEAISGLQESVSAVGTLDNLMKDNEALRTQVDTLEKERDQALTDAQTAQAAAADAAKQTAALNQLNELRGLYNQQHFKAARALLATWESAAPGALEQTLTGISNGLTQEEKDAYDPLEAYQQLVGWLS